MSDRKIMKFPHFQYGPSLKIFQYKKFSMQKSQKLKKLNYFSFLYSQDFLNAEKRFKVLYSKVSCDVIFTVLCVISTKLCQKCVTWNLFVNKFRASFHRQRISMINETKKSSNDTVHLFTALFTIRSFKSPGIQ